MSIYFRLMRERWAAREMTLTRWFKHGQDKATFGEPICEVRVDGQLRTVTMNDRSDVWGIYGPLVGAGEEVPPYGELFEYSDGGFVLAEPWNRRTPRQLHYRRRARYPRIFLNYRKEDSDAYAGRLHETLTGGFGADDVFMDLFSMHPGEPFPWAIQQSVAHCELVIALVGPKWSNRDAQGKRRLDSAFDYVRRELTAGLDRRIPILPLVLPGGTIPNVHDLPDEMQGFEQLQMLELNPRHWRADVDQVVAVVGDELKQREAARSS